MAIVEEKLAYCVNTVPSIQSTYFWEGKLCVDEELLLVIKTQEGKFTAVESWDTCKNHSYEIPELIALPYRTQGSADYLKCIDDWVEIIKIIFWTYRNMSNLTFPKPWKIAESESTPESIYMNRRDFIKGTSISYASCDSFILWVWHRSDPGSQRAH